MLEAWLHTPCCGPRQQESDPMSATAPALPFPARRLLGAATWLTSPLQAHPPARATDSPSAKRPGVGAFDSAATAHRRVSLKGGHLRQRRCEPCHRERDACRSWHWGDQTRFAGGRPSASPVIYLCA